MSHKRPRSPDEDRYSRTMRGRHDHDRNDSYDRYRPSQTHHNENSPRTFDHGHRGVGGPDYSRRDDAGEMWGISTDSWSSGRVRRDYQSSPQYVPNPLYNPRDDRRQGTSNISTPSGSGRHSRSSDGGPNPNPLFLEEVNLAPKFAFRLDSSSDTQLLSTESTKQNQMPNFFTTFYKDNVLGATEEYIKKNNIRSYLLNKSEEDDNNTEVEEPPPGTTMVRPTYVKTIQFIAMETATTSAKSDAKVDLTMAEKRENFNMLTRQYPEDVQTWRTFVNFQDEDCIDLKKKAKTEKKVAILEKALRTNPKSTELHFDRLDLLNEILKTQDVLTEWEKLLGANDSSEAVWVEHYKFIATQLSHYDFSSGCVHSQFTKGFERLRRFLSPNFPLAHVKPLKLNILQADVALGYNLLLRNSGWMEKSLAIAQAQMEFDFNFPSQAKKFLGDKTGWKEIVKLFGIFWDLDTLRFGEPSCDRGWKDVLEMSPEMLKRKEEPIGIKDSEVTAFEESFFDAVNESDTETGLTLKGWKEAKGSKWTWIEALRSKFYWIPWRQRVSDLEEADDSQRIIGHEVVTPFLVHIPEDNAYFRHTVNYLLILAHDFVPRTHTVESLLSPFSSLALTDSTVFFSELNYWGKLTDLYHSNPKGAEIIPEGFLLPNYLLPSTASIATVGKKLHLGPTTSATVSATQASLLRANQFKFHGMIRSVVKQALDHLSPAHASVLVQMLFRYEQKSILARDEEIKDTIEFCKGLMPHEKIRDSVEAYVEIGLVEYFGGRKKKTLSLLQKTIASSGKLLRESYSSSNSIGQFLTTNWEKIAGITRAYRLLAEFQLKSDKAQALAVLTSLGSGFELVTGEVTTKMGILKAKRFYEGIMGHLVTKKKKEQEEGLIEIDCDDEDVHEEFDKWGGAECLDFLAQKSNIIVEWTFAYALFTYLTEETFEAASEIFSGVVDKLTMLAPLSRSDKYSPRIVNCHYIREQLYITWCKLGAYHVTLHPMQNSKFRTVFGKALELYPASPPLLLLYMNVERQCSVVGKLWRSMVTVVKEPNPTDSCTLDWAPLFMCYALSRQLEEIEQDSEIALDEFGIGGPAVPPDTLFYKLDAIFSAAETNLLTRNCPLIWRLHLKHLVIRGREGKDTGKAAGLFYQAIRRCPSSKSLYMDAILYFPEMMGEVMDLMTQNDVMVRMPPEELDLLVQFSGDCLEVSPPPADDMEEGEVKATSSKKVKKSKKIRKRKKKAKKDGEDVEVISD